MKKTVTTTTYYCDHCEKKVHDEKSLKLRTVLHHRGTDAAGGVDPVYAKVELCVTCDGILFNRMKNMLGQEDMLEIFEDLFSRVWTLE